MLTAAKQSGKKTIFIGDKLKVNGKLYGVNDVNNLPADLNPQKTCTKSSNNMILFFWKHSFLSNFYTCDISIDNQKYTQSEQYNQQKKGQKRENRID